MPWNENDYPSSMKNLDKIVKRKAIDIGNKLIKEGYDEDSAIPIAISQAKKWKSNASKRDIEKLKKKDIEKHENDPKDTASRLQDSNINVKYDDKIKKWTVISEGAKQKDSSFKRKSDALDRAKEIASNKGTKVNTFKKNDSK